MKRKLTEMFNKVAEYNWTLKSSKEWEAGFYLPPSFEYIYMINFTINKVKSDSEYFKSLKDEIKLPLKTSDKPYLYVYFDFTAFKEGEDKPLDKLINLDNNRQFIVMSTVIHIIKEFFNKVKNIKLLVFSARPSEPSRVALYEKILYTFRNTVLKDYNIISMDKDGLKHFALIHKTIFDVKEK